MTNNDHSHPIKTIPYKPSYVGQILLNIHEIFSIGSLWAQRHEVIINLIQPHLPKVVMTYHDQATQLKNLDNKKTCKVRGK